MELILLTIGVVTSPNYANNYPDNLRMTKTIQVDQGLILSLRFSAFDIAYHCTCRNDHLTITEGDGRILMEKSCGYTLPANITSTSNIVKFIFITDNHGYGLHHGYSGWSVSWSALTPGECQQEKNQLKSQSAALVDMMANVHC